MVHLPEREIPVPSHLSVEAQELLSMPLQDPTIYPPVEDREAWKALAAARDRMAGGLVAAAAADPTVRVADLDVDGVRVFEVTPIDLVDDDRLCLDIHGGGFIYCSGDLCRALAVRTAKIVRTRVWAVDYRIPPDHPYPAALDDCLSVYRFALSRHAPEHVAVVGASAGGNLAAALIVRGRDEGLPLPAAAVLMTPAVDLTESGDSHHVNLGLDPRLRQWNTELFALYSGGHELTHPYVSPLCADFAQGFPPTILTTGTRDLLLSDTVRLHRALRNAGVRAELHVTEAAGHGGFLDTAPEDREIAEEIRRFVEANLSAPSATVSER